MLHRSVELTGPKKTLIGSSTNCGACLAAYCGMTPIAPVVATGGSWGHLDRVRPARRLMSWRRPLRAPASSWSRSRQSSRVGSSWRATTITASVPAHGAGQRPHPWPAGGRCDGSEVDAADDLAVAQHVVIV